MRKFNNFEKAGMMKNAVIKELKHSTLANQISTK